MKKYRLIVFLIWVLFAIAGYLWLRIDTLPLMYDQAAYLEQSLGIYNALRVNFATFVRSVFSTGEYFNSYRPYRVLMPLSSAILYFVFSPSSDVAVMTNMFCMFILFFSLYGIGAQLFNRKIGLFAVFVMATFPLTFHASMQYRAEVITAAMVALSIYLLIRSELFKKRIPSLLFGVSFGLGMVSKELFPVHMFGLMVYLLFLIFNRREKGQRLNYCLSVILGIGIASIWYWPHLKDVLAALQTTYGEIGILHYGMPKQFTLASFLFYPLTILDHGISFFYTVIFCISIIPFFKKMASITKDALSKQNVLDNKNIYKWLIILWISVPYLVLTSSNGKVLFYYLPAFPPIAIIISAGILSLKVNKIRKVSIALVIIFSLVQFFAFNFGISALPQSLYWYEKRDVLGKPIVFFDQPSFSRPRREDWKTKEMLQYIEALQKIELNSDESYIVGVLPNCKYISADVLNSYKFILEFSLMIIPHVGSLPGADHGYGISVDQCDYVVTKSGDQGHLPPYPLREINQQVIEFLEHSDLFVKLPREFRLPDGSKVVIYKNIQN